MFISFYAQSRCRSTLLVSTQPRITVVWKHRSYATHRDSIGSSALSQSLDTKQQGFRPNQSVGPFQLASGSIHSTERVKKWSELSTAGKIKRTGARTSNLAVIVFGAGLSAVLIYCLTSELFSKNSPTVLYSEACERIKSSPEVAKYLHGPLVFHTTAPSLERPRHRNHQVSSQIVLDQYNREHMYMNFYVQARPPGSLQYSDSYYKSMLNWMRERTDNLSDMSYDDVAQWAKDCSSSAWEKFQRSFKYLTGAPQPAPSTPEVASSEAENEKRPQSTLSQVTGLFSSLRRTPTNSTDTRSDGKSYTDGEVHADFVRNNDGYFVCRYILVNIPSSSTRSPIRVFVERGPGVRDNEPIVRWHSS
ncbi:tim21-like mitochondrial-like [Moniliophthora roreri]|uniref:Mitochondrial import inner membrane translocase subunit Tim21 n=1 Tax=Moniliophthora roreri TaxID=221103 RepID=A0A0W0FXY4_MONRR|nr:tim21-like mitochondrial-like [Moniliophthora roreri]